MLWHDMDKNIVPGKGGKFYNHIAKIKSIVRKPNWDMDEYVIMTSPKTSLKKISTNKYHCIEDRKCHS